MTYGDYNKITLENHSKIMNWVKETVGNKFPKGFSIPYPSSKEYEIFVSCDGDLVYIDINEMKMIYNHSIYKIDLYSYQSYKPINAMIVKELSPLSIDWIIEKYDFIFEHWDEIKGHILDHLNFIEKKENFDPSI